jgi:hypothetical protein
MLQDSGLAIVIFVLLLGASALGMFLHGMLGERHRTNETFDHVRLVVSILVTFTALVLGLVMSEVRGSFNTFDSRLRAFAGDITGLDMRLREYGEDAAPIREKLREYTAAAIADTWRDEPPPPGAYPKFPEQSSIERQQLGALLIDVDTAVHRLEPADGFHKRMAASLENRLAETLQARRLVIETAHDTISWPLLVAMCGWLAIVFGVYGLIAPRNVVVHVTILLCAFCVASAIFFIVEFDTPLTGLLRVSSGPLRDALTHIDGA